MQATQSGIGLGSGLDADVVEGGSGRFAALRHVMRRAVRRTDKRGLVGTVSNGAELMETPATTQALMGVAEGAGLAHDAGNLLGALSLYSDLLAMPGVLHEEHREYASELRMLSDRSWAMIDRLVNHARAGRQSKAGPETSVLPDVVDRCRGILSRVAGRTVEISYGVGAFQPVPVSVESVERILTNLVKNAAEATPWVGAISIHVEGLTERVLADGEEHEEPRRRVVMTVRDRGCGMDAAAVRRLMQTGGISSANGRGLGFRVVRELVAISGGCLQIDSQPEMGTSISVEWYGVKDTAEGLSARNDAQMRQVVKGEAGWIAC
jgi:signal transduction histidine kinase